MVIFHSYVSLPEGKLTLPAGDFNDLKGIRAVKKGNFI